MVIENEVFIVTLNESDDKTKRTEIILADSLQDTNDALMTESSGSTNNNTIKIYHGILTEATFIPTTFNGCTPYIVAFNPIVTYNDFISQDPINVFFEKISIMV